MSLHTEDKPTILKDMVPLMTELKTEEEVTAARKLKLPLFRGELIEVDDYGNEVLVGKNTMTWGGGIFALEKMFGVEAEVKPSTLNQIYGLNDDIVPDNDATYCRLFGIGIGGCGLSFNTVNQASFKQRELEGFIPIRVDSAATLTGTDADKYYFRREQEDGTYAFYLKEMQQDPSIVSQWKDSVEEDEDGTKITEEIYDSTRSELVEAFAECPIRVVTKDVRTYFSANGDIGNARFNTLGLFVGQKVEIEPGYYDYINVRLFSVLNFENVSVKDKAKYDYLYRVYVMM